VIEDHGPAPISLRSPEAFEIEGFDGGPLRGDLYEPDVGAAAAGRAVILCHGFRGYKDWGFLPLLASRLADEGFPALTFSTSASGVTDHAGTFGEPERFRRGTYSGDLEDVRRVVDWASARVAGAGRDVAVGLVGHSRGGVIALLHASVDPRARALATIGAPERIGVWPERYFDEWRAGRAADVYDFRTRATLRLGPEILDDLTRNGARYDTAAAAARLRAPLLVVHGTRDALVPLDEARALAALSTAAAVELRVVEGAGHSFQAGDELRRTPPPLLEMIESVAAWMRRWL
jgi:dienelactone hydrolase